MIMELININPIVPHKGKMLLLSRIICYDLKEQTINAEYDITENCIFYNSAIQGVPSYAGFEFIAQAISALFGIKKKESAEDIKIGYIISVSSMQIEIQSFKAGSTVQINAKADAQMDKVCNFEGTIFLDGKKVLEGKLAVYEV